MVPKESLQLLIETWRAKTSLLRKMEVAVLLTWVWLLNSTGKWFFVWCLEIFQYITDIYNQGYFGVFCLLFLFSFLQNYVSLYFSGGLLGIELRILHILNIHSATKSHLQPLHNSWFSIFYSFISVYLYLIFFQIVVHVIYKLLVTQVMDKGH